MKRKENLMKYRQDLKKVSLITDIRKRREAILKLSATWEVSDKTIYRDLVKAHPGVAKPRKDIGRDRVKTTKKEAGMISELVKAGKSRKEAAKVVEKKTGRKVSTRRLVKISKKTESVKNPVSRFAEPLRKILEKHFEVDRVAPDASVKIKSGKYKILLTKQDCEDIILILTNACNRKHDPKLPFDRKALLKAKIDNIIEMMVKEAEQRMDIKMLNQISLIKQRMDVDVSELSPNFQVVEKVCKVLKPDITFDEIFALIEQFSE